MERRSTRLRCNKSAFRTLHRSDFFDLGTWLPSAGASKLAIQAGFRPPFTCLVQPLKAAPRSGHGRLPKAPRVHACEAQPRAPHRPSGCPSGQLSLCPTSVTPLEAPLTGQDASRIREVSGTGIGIHSQVRERKLSCPGRSAAWSTCGTVRCRAVSASTRVFDALWSRLIATRRNWGPGSAKQRFARATRCIAPGTRVQPPPKILPDRDRRSSTDLRRS
jgi:hypothetical protein